MTTNDFIEAIRSDLKRELCEEILAELQPEITRRLFSNVFNFAEAAKYLKVSISTLRRMVADNEIPYYRHRGNLFFRQMDIDRNIDQKVRSVNR